MPWGLSVRRALPALVLLASCAPEIPNTPPGEFVIARFDPSAAPPVVPTPNDLVTDPATGLLSVPVPAEASAADKWFYDWLNTLNGFPAAVGASVTFSQQLDPTTITSSTVRVFDLTANNAPVEATRVYSDSTSTAAPGQLAISPPVGGWTPGHRYAVAIIGGVNGVRGKTGLTCVGSATWAFLRNEGKLIDCPGDDLGSPACRLTSEIVPSSITEDQGRRLADQLATAKRLEPLRKKYQTAVDFLVSQGVARSELALLWTFRIDDSASFVFDPSASPARVPTPTNLAIKQGLVSTPIDPGSSPAAQEWARTWLNTLNGFPPSSAAGADIAQQPIDPVTLSDRTVRVRVLSGGPLTSPPTVTWNAQLGRIVLTPAGGSWGNAKTIAVAMIGGASGIKAASGQRLVASQVWALVRSAAPLVDCEVLSPTCGSFVKAAPISTNQAIALESLRRTYAPLLDQLATEGIARRDVAGAWIFSTLDQPELVFDPSAAPPRVPTPTDLVIDPATGKVKVPVPAGASPAYAEFISDYLNTLDGFPVSTPAVVEIAGQLDSASINANTVRVSVVSGPALSGAPTVAFDAATARVTVAPPSGSWGKGRSIAIAVLGGSAGVRSTTGKPLAASQAFSFVRLSNSLVDPSCGTVGPSCRSVTALSDAQAIGLEPIRRALKPVFDTLETTGLPREDIAGLWVFRTVSQAELTFDLSQAVVPFPNNQLLRGNSLPDGGTQAGFVVVLPDGGAPGDDAIAGTRLSLPIPTGASASQAQLLAGLNTLDGFSTTAPIVSENGATQAALDLGTIDAGSLTGAGLLELGDQLDGGARSASARACLSCTSSRNDAGVVDQPEQLQWVPETPLADATRHAVFVSTAVTDSRGRPVMAAPTFALVRSKNSLLTAAGTSAVPVIGDAQANQLEPVRLRFKGCLDRLEAAGHPRSTLALGFCFTTQSIVAPVRSIAGGVRASSIPTTIGWGYDTGTMILPRLALAGVPTSNIASITEFEVTMPWALTGPGATLNPNPAAWEARRALATLVLPTGTMPSAGFPIVVYGHGLGRSRSDILSIANTFTTAGFAVIAIDAPLHGARSDCRLAPVPDAACEDQATQQCNMATGRCVARPPTMAPTCVPLGGASCFNAGQGRCLPGNVCEGGDFKLSGPVFTWYGNPEVSGAGFLDLVNLFKTRDDFRHMGAADLVQLERILSATGPNSLDAYLSSVMATKLDASKLHYVGQSLGSFNGAVWSASSATPQRLGLNVAGSDQVDVLLTAPGFASQRAAFLSSLAGAGVVPGTAGFDSFVVLARTILDPADPQNLVRAGLDSPNANRRLFVPYIEQDAVLPNSGTTKLLRAGLGANDSSRLAWYQFTAHAGVRAPGKFPASWPIAGRHGFLLDPGGAPGSATINPECDSTSTSFDATTCATLVVRGQLAQFLSAGTTPANFPVTP